MLTAQEIRTLVEICFCLEPLLNKKDCTTRYDDLDGKPLYDFIISGISPGVVFEKYWTSLESENKQIFSHFKRALKKSIFYRHKKVINVGLIEFMFVVLRARHENNSIDKALNSLANLIKRDNPQDVLDYVDAFNFARTFSNNEYKKELQETIEKDSKNIKNIYDLMLYTKSKCSDSSKSAYQVSNEYLKTFPILNRYISEIEEEKGILQSIENSYNQMHKEDPNIKIGILADFAASAMFLYLSYKDKDNYIIC